MPVKIFFCYAREDEPLLNKLKTHLRPLQWEGLIEVWYDRDISAGAEWDTEIKEHLNEAQIILLLVSSDFMASEYSYSNEMKQALERRSRGEAEVIPIILRHVDWHGGPLGKLQALPKDGKPVTDSDWHSPDKAFYDVATGIRKVVEKLTSIIPPLPIEKLRLLRTIIASDSFIVWGLAISPDGQTLVSISTYGEIKTWNLATGKELRTLFSGRNRLSLVSVTISPDGQTLVGGDETGKIKIWNLTTVQELRTLTSHTPGVTSLAISSDRQTLGSVSNDATIKIWNLTTGQELRTLTGHTKAVWGIAISPDGQTLASGSADGTIKIWNLITGEEQRTIASHTSAVSSVTIGPDGQTLFTGLSDLTIKTWNLSTGKEMGTLTTGRFGLAQSLKIAISPDGQTLVSGNLRTIKVWGI